MELYTIYAMISDSMENIPARKQCIALRKCGLNSTIYNNGFNKIAFDTRRINQETEYNPRRGLQNYNRSEEFLSQAMGEKLVHLTRLKSVLDELKKEYGKEHEWQDSNARVLLSTLDQGLRTIQKDGNFSNAQPSQGSLDYIEELLHVRYRLDLANLNKLGNLELKKTILSKDEELTRKDVNRALEITKSDVASQTYDTLMEKLFGGVRATKENPDVERSITITIRDKFVEK